MKFPWRTVFLFAVFVAILWIGYLARSVVTPLFAAVLLAYVLDPLVQKIQRIGLSRNAASALVVVVTFGLIATFGAYAGMRVAEEIRDFSHEVRGEPLEVTQKAADTAASALVPRPYVGAVTWRGDARWYVDLDGDHAFDPGLARLTAAKVEGWLKESLWTEKLAGHIADAAEKPSLLASTAGTWTVAVFQGGTTVASVALSLITLFILFPIYLYYSLSQLSHVYDVVVHHLPSGQRDRIVEILQKVHVTLAAFFRGRLILLVIRFVFMMAVFLAFDTPFAAVCAAFGTAASLVPILGSVASIAVPLALGIAAGSGSGVLLSLLLVLVAFEVVEQYALTPAIVGKSVGLHPLTILVATLIAGELLGIFGMIVAIPVTAVVKILWLEFVMPEIRRHAGLAEPPRPEVVVATPVPLAPPAKPPETPA